MRWLLLNPRYASVRLYNGEEVGRGSWPPIVSDETYYAARAADPDSWLSGMRRLQGKVDAFMGVEK